MVARGHQVTAFLNKLVLYLAQISVQKMLMLMMVVMALMMKSGAHAY